VLEETLARNLIKIRNKNNWTQETVAELCDLSVRYWGKMERCQTTATLSTLNKITTGLNISAAELLNEAPAKNDGDV